jgi:hypothetical protein
MATAEEILILIFFKILVTVYSIYVLPMYGTATKLKNLSAVANLILASS